MTRPILSALALLLFSAPMVEGQIPRERAVAERPVELTFPTPRHINLQTTEPLAAGEMYYSIMHTFGEIDQGRETLWGLDSGANIRFSLEYGFTDRLSVLLARSSMDRVYEMGVRTHLVRQMQGGGTPVSASLNVAGGIMTLPSDFLAQEFSFVDRTNLAVTLPISRAMGDRLSLMVSPMFAVLSRTDEAMRIDDPADRFYGGVGMGGRYAFSSIRSLTFQYLPATRRDASEIRHGLGIGLDLETGGHVFQMFLTNTQALNDAYLLAAPVGSVSDGGLRFGFNVNRSFSMR
ncbi:MAG: hypothetical protein EA422_03515 [Gemmatimonadales bacterium]|nr:MAG: hypothetical protein EA422_03515 [Gemmatimonadales bacterium]